MDRFRPRQYARTATRYTTDLTDTEFALIAPHLPAPSRLGRPRKMDLREVLDAILYLLRTGCPWAPAAQGVAGQEHGVRLFPALVGGRHLSAVLRQAGRGAREQAGREASPTAGIVDSQSVRTTEGGGPRGYDAGKKINGRKRHILVDTLGLLLVASSTPPTSRIAMGWRWSAAACAGASPGSA